MKYRNCRIFNVSNRITINLGKNIDNKLIHYVIGGIRNRTRVDVLNSIIYNKIIKKVTIKESSIEEAWKHV